MALPASFVTPEEYFEESLRFFKEYQDLYNFSNTEILVKNVLDYIDIQDVENLNIYDENFNLEIIDDHFLKTFFKRVRRLRVHQNEFAGDTALEDIFDVPLSPKKKHEIVYLAKEIKESCVNIGCNTVVDFGSGLGYLDQLIFETTNFKVLGIECNQSYYVTAKKRQLMYHKNSRENVKHVKHTLNEDSSTNIKMFLEEKFVNYQGFCITGLHACADLTVDALKIFLKMDDANCLILMPCCYHRMSFGDKRFKNFPLSKCMMESFDRHKGFEYMEVSFLRLGAQPPNVAVKLEDSVFNLLARAVLEQYAQKHNYKLKRNKRKAVKTKKMDNNFDSYVEDATSHGFTLIKTDHTNIARVEFNVDELRLLWSQIDENKIKKAGIFILLQNFLQPVIENFIMFDRLMYLKENNIENCRCKKIFNEALSPRCLALIARK